MFTRELGACAKHLPVGSPPVLVAHPIIGEIGKVIPGKGFKPSMSKRSLDALLKDEEAFKRDAKRLLLLGEKLFYDERGAIASWDNIVASRAGGKADDFIGFKASQTTVANVWSSFARSTGVPGAMSYTAIPGAVMNRASAGAWPLTNPVAPDKKYLLNMGVNHATGTNIAMLVDLLVTAGNINANLNTSQAINTPALTRYTDGAGVMMTLEVTTAVGATASNVTVGYTNSAGTAGRSTADIAMTASAIANRLQPVAAGPFITLAAGDLGVRSVQTVQFSAAMGAGVCALHLYKPLILVPTLLTTAFVEKSSPSMMSSLLELPVGTDSQLGCLTFFVLTSTTSTGLQTYDIRTVAG